MVMTKARTMTRDSKINKAKQKMVETTVIDEDGDGATMFDIIHDCLLCQEPLPEGYALVEESNYLCHIMGMRNVKYVVKAPLGLVPFSIWQPRDYEANK